MRAKDALGQLGESLAAEHLVAQGMQLVARNWRCNAGEIDIVARDGSVFVFCEVRTRTSERYGTPLSTITPAKFSRMHTLAIRWLIAHQARGSHFRIDVVGIIKPRNGAVVLRHIRGAS